MKPAISVVIPALNEEKFIGNCLASLSKQEFNQDFEIIVVDNGSADRTCEIAKKAGARVISEHQKGVQFARQAGFEAALAEVIASTDADAVLPANWLSKIWQEFSKNSQLIGISGPIKPLNGNLSEEIFLLMHTMTNLMQYLVGFSFFTGQNFVVRRQAFEMSGGFSRNSISAEEGDLFAKIKHFGQVKYVPGLTVSVSMRRIRNLGFLSMTLWSFKAWFTLNVFKNSPRPKLTVVRGQKIKKKNEFINQIFLVVLLVSFGALLFFIVTTLAIPVTFWIAGRHFLIQPRGVVLKRLAVASFLILVFLLPVSLYIWSNTSFARENDFIQKIRHKITELNQNINSVQLQKIFQANK